MQEFDDHSDLIEPDYPEDDDRTRDTKIDEAKNALLDYFAEHDRQVFYERQLEVIHEKPFYHWITSKALNELVEEGNLKSVLLEPQDQYRIRVYFVPAHRYWRRQANQLAQLVQRFSSPRITAAIGVQGEMMFDAALPAFGFLPVARDLNSFNGREWKLTAHTLDRVFERDGVFYGTEVKNTLKYIDLNELNTKLEMCVALHLRPLFILRWAPKHYIHLINQAGGFALLFKYQLYPLALADLARLVRERLFLPADAPRRIQDGTVQRLLKWHARNPAP